MNDSTNPDIGERFICLVAATNAHSDLLNSLYDQFDPSARWLSLGGALELGPFPAEQAKICAKQCEDLTAGKPIDLGVIPKTGRRKQLLASDMDSTIITIECIDELAALVGKKTEIAAITDRAMAGQLDFDASLVERVRCLAGVHIQDVQRVCREMVEFSPGAKELIATLNARNVHTILVSGGFTIFTSYVAKALGFKAHFSNELEIVDQRLSGKVRMPIFGPNAKVAVLTEYAKSHGIAFDMTAAIGDGANDIPMIQAAGFGIAYKARKKLRDQAKACINHTDLKTALYFQGYADNEIQDLNANL